MKILSFILHNVEENLQQLWWYGCFATWPSQKYEAGLKHDVELSDVEASCNKHEVKTSNKEVIAIDDKPSWQLKVARLGLLFQLQMNNYKMYANRVYQKEYKVGLEYRIEVVRKSASSVEDLEKTIH